MRLELRATSYDDRECCNDFNWDGIDDPIHLEFLKWSLFLEGRITLLSQNIKYYEEFNKLLFGNENALKKYKTFFTFLALAMLLMFAREISYGRVFVDENVIHFNKKLCHILVGIYIGASVLYALIKKVWVDIINIIKTENW